MKPIPRMMARVVASSYFVAMLLGASAVAAPPVHAWPFRLDGCQLHANKPTIAYGLPGMLSHGHLSCTKSASNVYFHICVQELVKPKTWIDVACRDEGPGSGKFNTASILIIPLPGMHTYRTWLGAEFDFRGHHFRNHDTSNLRSVTN
jgi:hypothetical protein